MRRIALLSLPFLLLLTSCGSFVEDVQDEVVNELESEFDTTSDYEYDPNAVFLSDFEDACQGAATKKGVAYSDAAGTHPVVVFDRDSASETYYQTSYILPEAWEATYENPELTELVACVTTIPGDFVEACEYDIEGVAYTLNNNGASYEVELYEAMSGELVDSTTLEVPTEECPMFWFFYETTEEYYPAYDQALTDWVKPYAQR